MLSIEEYIARRKKEDRIDEFDVNQRLENIKICVNYVFEYFNNYLDITEAEEKTALKEEKVPERNTSTTCPVCGKRVNKARVHRGLFVHCGQALNADLVGAYNILQRYLRETDLSLPGWTGVVGDLARPAVNLFVWRKTTPKGREQGTFRQAV